MADVIDLSAKRRERELVWICRCGCTVHYLHADGHLECGSCGRVFETTGCGEWRRRLPDAPGEVAELDDANFKIVPTSTPDVYAKRLLRDHASRPLAAIVAIFLDGAVSTWGSPEYAIETDAQKAWLRRQIAKATKRMMGGV